MRGRAHPARSGNRRAGFRPQLAPLPLLLSALRLVGDEGCRIAHSIEKPGPSKMYRLDAHDWKMFTILGVLLLEPGKVIDVFAALNREEDAHYSVLGKPPCAFSLRILDVSLFAEPTVIR